ncbi:hypothetical protein L085_08545 [Serratia sp. FS14]|uniref:hypothetical protein n=1 Tax=Serratia sp. (strain FS14) TaxID=1327989 RepID=UPI0004995696|nr:hypothetical protein [Serratia sp. FS14]AIA47156.1 hypothetical protein L085_08545 [Serratia sp. FS14]
MINNETFEALEKCERLCALLVAMKIAVPSMEDTEVQELIALCSDLAEPVCCHLAELEGKSYDGGKP